MTRKLPLHGDLPAASLLLAGIAMSATLVRGDDVQTAALGRVRPGTWQDESVSW